MKWTCFWRFVLLFSATWQLFSAVSAEAQQDRPLLNLFYGVVHKSGSIRPYDFGCLAKKLTPHDTRHQKSACADTAGAETGRLPVGLR